MSTEDKDLIIALIYAYKAVLLEKIKKNQKLYKNFPEDDYLMGQKDTLEDCYTLWNLMFDDID